ncbi:MAG: SRPBCC family protein [Bacteroidota bacterium]
MKVLKIIGTILIALLLLFFSVGLIWPTFSYESKVIVNAPIDQSWEVFTDTSHSSKWMEGFKSIKTISKEPDEVGSTYELIFNSNGEEIKLLETVTHYDVNNLYGMDIQSDVLYNESLIYFDSESDKTVITAKNSVSGNGMFWKSLLYIMKSTFQETSDQQYEKLKKVIENQSR